MILPPDVQVGTYRLRRVVAGDTPLLESWFREPHVTEWWPGPGQVDEILSHIPEEDIDPFLIEWSGRWIGYLQVYRVTPDHPYADVAVGGLGCDQFIGASDLLGQGHGSGVLRALAQHLFASSLTTVLVTDPEPGNARAIRAYQKAGFVPVDERSSIYGPALLMIWRGMAT